MTQFSRRSFLTASAATFAGASGMFGSLTGGRAWAADTTGYKAIVCVFLKGGWDHGDTVLPVDTASHNALGNIRPGIFGAYGVGSGTSSRDIANLAKLNADNAGAFGGREFGLPPQYAGLADMFDGGDLAVIGNVGPLLEPTTRDEFEAATVELPPRLFSHNDQQSTWMSLDVEGSRYGWGGRFADATSANLSPGARSYSAIATGGNDVFLSGNTVQQFSLPGSGGGELDVIDNRGVIGGNSRFDPMREAIREYYLRNQVTSSSLFARDIVDAQSQGLVSAQNYRTALEQSIPINTAFPPTRLGGQLAEVAEAMTVSGSLGVPRQVFYVTGGGFDTHSNQVADMPALQSEINDALMAFRSAMLERGLWNDVVVFTASDFGRTTIDNGDGTDHGWGSHHFVMGGEVAGRRIYGDIPAPDLDLPSYTERRGRMIPSTSVEQYAATMGRWFGLSESELGSALPNLERFPSTDLGFMGSPSG
ncbi:MAG: DUF1501 domain-containing protein [Pseudomonadota bacterium]